MRKNYILLLGIILLQIPLLLFAQQDESSIPKGTLKEVPVQLANKIFNEKPSEIIFDENFKSGFKNWTVNGDWNISSETSSFVKTNTKAISTSKERKYANNSDEFLISPLISLKNINKGTKIYLNISETFEIESGYDKGLIKISKDNGRSWQIIGARSGLGKLRESHINLSRFAGNDIKLKFEFISDSSINYAGWFINEIKISTYIQPLALGTKITSLNSQNFPFIYMNVDVKDDTIGVPNLNQSNFLVYENNTLQTDLFNVTPPQTGGGIRRADIIFLMDNSGSMDPYQIAVRDNVIDFVDSLASSGVDFSLGLCRYGESGGGNPIIEDNGILTNDANYFKNDVWLRNTTDGGTEPGYFAITESASNFSFRPGSQKIFIEITDETPNQGGATLQDAINSVVNGSITLFALTDLSLSSDFDSLARVSNGNIFDIYSPFDQILDYIKNQVSSTYVLSYRSSDPNFNGVQRDVEVRVNYNSEQASDFTQYTPGAAPTITRTNPTIALHQQAWADGTSFDIEVEVVDNISPGVQSVTLYYKNTNDVSYQSIQMSNTSGDLYSATIPGGDVATPGLDYYITATDGISTSSDPSTNPSANPYQIAILPNVAPSITHTPVTALTVGNDIIIDATVVDNTNSLAEVDLYYRKIGQLNYTRQTMINNSGDNYTGTIPGSRITSDGIEYYIYAYDDFGVGNSSGTADYPHTIKGEEIYDLGFDPKIDGWGFSNGDGIIWNYVNGDYIPDLTNAIMWPESWWSKIDYTLPVYPKEFRDFALSSDFPDWDLFALAFGDESCYIDPTGPAKIFNPTAVEKWKAVKGNWGGSCFGFAITSLLFFDKYLELNSIYPGVNNLNSVPFSDDSREFINKYFIYQFGKNHQDHINDVWNNTPKQTLKEIISSFNTKKDNVTLGIYNYVVVNGVEKIKGGHAIVPFKITNNPLNNNEYFIYVYDNNSANKQDRIIVVDTVANTWKYNPLGWGYTKGLIAMESIKEYVSNPILNKISESQKEASSGFIEVYSSTKNDILISNQIGNQIGVFDNELIQNIQEGHPIIPMNPFSTIERPIGYYIPDDEYKIKLENYEADSTYFTIFNDTKTYNFTRKNISKNQNDILNFDNSLSFSNTGDGEKIINFKSIFTDFDNEKVYKTKNITVNNEETIKLNLMDNADLKLDNNGNEKEVDLEVNLYSSDSISIFKYDKLLLENKTSYQFSPNWNNLSGEPIAAFIDKDMDGKIDEIKYLTNQYIENTPKTNGKLDDSNIYFYPNPFNPSNGEGLFRYSLAKSGNVTIKVYDVSNNLVRTFEETGVEANVEKSATWDGKDQSGNIVSNGVYFYVIESSTGERAVGKIAVLK